MVKRVVDGRGPDDNAPDDKEGARIVCNISSAHIPALCVQGATYKNGYDLGKYRIGDEGSVPRRRLVDQSLPIDESHNFEKIYFCAVEVNGTGVRFYGDLCLVLKPGETPDDTIILDRNSYDLLRPPLSNGLHPNDTAQMTQATTKLAGRLGKDLGDIAAIKTLQRRPATARRLTTGQISNAILEDEDYVEVLKIGTFDANSLEEVRSSAGDAAADVQIGERLGLGITPSAQSLLWRKRRHDAERALKSIGVGIRVVTTAGRVRS